MDVRERVDRVLRDQLGPGIDWDHNSQLRDDGLGLDCLDMVELAMRLEEEFVLRIPEDDFESSERIDTVGDVIAYLERRLSARPALFAA